MEKIILVDGNNLAHKIFAIYKLKDETDYKNKLIYLFFENIVKFQEFIVAENFVLCFDDKKNFRKEICPVYKANRKDKNVEDKIKVIECIEEIKNNFIEFFNIFNYSKMEADDLAYAFSLLYNNEYEIILYSSDKDWAQIQKLNENIKQYATLSLKEVLYEDDLLLKKAIIGDSDNIKGVKGIGEKRFPEFKEKLLNGDKSIKEFIPIIKQNIELVTLSKNPYLNEIEKYIRETFIKNKFNKFLFFNKMKVYNPEIYTLFLKSIIYL